MSSFQLSLGFYPYTWRSCFSSFSDNNCLISYYRCLLASILLTFLHYSRIKNLKAIAYLGNFAYLCIEMSGKGSISRMSDECLMKQETVFSFYTQYQAVKRKFTLAGKTVNSKLNQSASAPQYINELLWVFRSTQRPEAAANSTGHYYYVVISHYILQFYYL